MHLLSLSAPGVQMHDAARATELAAAYNDELASGGRSTRDRRPHPARGPASPVVCQSMKLFSSGDASPLPADQGPGQGVP
jgi:hypothetical protein